MGVLLEATRLRWILVRIRSLTNLAMPIKTAAIMAFLFLIGTAAANPIEFASGPSQVALIELYSSEGCSSCPPAERWLDDLRENPGLWKEFVPVEFHVTYWNGLGWKDSLSSPAFTDREYAYASAWGSKNVYTPCFVRNGAEWRPSSGPAQRPKGESGYLTVSIGEDNVCRIKFLAGNDPERVSAIYEAHLALLGGGISSKVTAGENNGATLMHEFVVLGMKDEALSSEGKDPALSALIQIPRSTRQGARRLAVAAWVTRYGELAPIQATGGWLR